MLHVIRALVMGLAVLALASPTLASNRLALVVGIDDYPRLSRDMQLRMAVNDARTMAETLESIGFDVELAVNVDRTGFLTALERVKRKTGPGDTVFMFFAGHGVALRGSNLLLPADIPPLDPDSEALLRGLSVAETDLIEAVREQGAGLTVLALDACRDNPIEAHAREQARIQGRPFRSLGAMRSVGLDVRPTSGVFSIYSAGIGQMALDRLGEDDAAGNSVFTRVFARKLRQSGSHLAEIMEDVKAEVTRLAETVIDPDTGLPHQQFPAYYNETRGGRIYLAGRTAPEAAPAPSVPSVAAPRPAPEPVRDPCAGAETHWRSAERLGSRLALEDHFQRFGSCAFAGLAKAKIAALTQPPPRQPEPQVAAPPPPRDAAPVVTKRVKRDVSLGYLNLRSAPGQNARIVARIPAGAGGVVITGGCRDARDGVSRFPFCPVEWSGHRGWVSGNGLE